MEVILEKFWNSSLHSLGVYSLHCTIMHWWSQRTAYAGHALHSNNSHKDGFSLVFCVTCFSFSPSSFFSLVSPLHNPLSYKLRLSLLPEMTPCYAHFPPCNDSTHIIAPRNTCSTTKRQSFGNKPHHYQLLCDPRAPLGGTDKSLQKHLLGWGVWSWDNTQWALPIQQSIIHCLLVCTYVHLIYNKACFISLPAWFAQGQHCTNPKV